MFSKYITTGTYTHQTLSRPARGPHDDGAAPNLPDSGARYRGVGAGLRSRPRLGGNSNVGWYVKLRSNVLPNYWRRYMSSWASKRPASERRITLNMDDDMKNMLVKTKALTGKSFRFQLNEAMRDIAARYPQFLVPKSSAPSQPCESPFTPIVSGPPQPSTVIPQNNCPQSPDPLRPILPGKYDSMRSQPINRPKAPRIDRTNIPWKV